ncbi:MAG: nicotinate-nucleotide adenylyltransferase [Candidatus Saelkia tenebricola]|nr:nicotinate-nucleotide adenylyltransferase [Candidatus Saelkia tenebricola]
MGKSGNKIGILGGCFDPVHIGHLILGQYALNKFKLEKILFIPSNIPPHKKKTHISSYHRYNMLKLAVLDNPKFEVLRIEIKRTGVSYSYDTLKELIKKYPQTEFYFILGSDAFKEIGTWKNYSKLIKIAGFIVAGRENFDIKNPVDVKMEKLIMPKISISSSYLRKRVKDNKSIRYLMSDKTVDYINAYNLYR